MKKIFLALSIIILSALYACTSNNKNMTSINNDLDYSSLNELDFQKDTITLKIDGNNLNLKTPIYIDKNRYYLCLNDIIDNLNGNITSSDNTLKITALDKEIYIDTQNNKVTTDNKDFTLKKQLIKSSDFYYICFSDFAQMFNLHSRWDIKSKTIRCKINGDNIENVKAYSPKIDTKGYLRIEDVALTTQPYDTEYLEKLRIMGNYLSKKNVPYHIAWIPRYICPNKGIDIDLLSRNDFQCAELVYTLDYLSSHNAIIGLHGYTHQRGNEESAIGAEFGYKYPSVSEFNDRIQKALDIAQSLDIPIDFFEAPHYEITPEQNRAAENFFKILYYPFKDNGPYGIDYSKPQVSPHNSNCHYVSAYLDYVHENKTENFINKVNNADTGNMGSMFFHPRLDFKYINLYDNDGIPEFNYSDDSILKRIIDALEKKGYIMSSVKDIG